MKHVIQYISLRPNMKIENVLIITFIDNLYKKTNHCILLDPGPVEKIINDIFQTKTGLSVRYLNDFCHWLNTSVQTCNIDHSTPRIVSSVGWIVRYSSVHVCVFQCLCLCLCLLVCLSAPFNLQFHLPSSAGQQSSLNMSSTRSNWAPRRRQDSMSAPTNTHLQVHVDAELTGGNL